MTILSSNNTILIQKPDDCVFDININPASLNVPTSFTEDTSSIDLSGNGTISDKIRGSVKISSTATNVLQSLGDGLFVPQGTNSTITLVGDILGSGTTSINTTLNNTGVTPGTYNTFTVNSQGRITNASNAPTQAPLTLTTNGTNIPATLVSNVLNVPNYVYTLPTATNSVLGGVKVGAGLSITLGGVLSAVGMIIDGTITNANINGGLLYQQGGLLKQSSSLVVDLSNISAFINTPYSALSYMTCIGTDLASGSGSNSSICMGEYSNAGNKIRGIFLGRLAGSSVNSTEDSIAIGFGAGSRGNGSSVKTYNRIISIGMYSNSDSFLTVSNSVAIGNHAGNTASNQINLGNCVYISNIVDISSGGTSALYVPQTNPLVGIGISIPSAGVDINTQNSHNPIRIRKTYTPTSSSDSVGDIGTICIDDNYIYKKTAAGWTRSAIFTTF